MSTTLTTLDYTLIAVIAILYIGAFMHTKHRRKPNDRNTTKKDTSCQQH